MEPGSGSFPTKYVCALKHDINYLPVHYKNIQMIYHNLEKDLQQYEYYNTD